MKIRPIRYETLAGLGIIVATIILVPILTSCLGACPKEFETYRTGGYAIGFLIGIILITLGERITLREKK
jgi:hypothetical protein